MGWTGKRGFGCGDGIQWALSLARLLETAEVDLGLNGDVNGYEGYVKPGGNLGCSVRYHHTT